MRTFSFLILQTEKAKTGIVNGNVINSIAFNYLAAQDVQITGNIILYLQNTADATNTKSTTWSTAITGMKTVSNCLLILNPVKDVINFDSTVDFENEIIKVSDLNGRLIKSVQNVSSIKFLI